MKTQVNEWREMKSQGILMIAFYVFIVAGVFIGSGGQSEVVKRESSGNPDYSAKETSAEALEVASGTPEFLSERMMNNLEEALMPIEEQSLSLSAVNSLVFPFEGKNEKVAETTENSLISNMLARKHEELAKECAMYWSVKECLKMESEKPLEVEDWMTDDQIWNNKTTAEKK